MVPTTADAPLFKNDNRFGNRFLVHTKDRSTMVYGSNYCELLVYYQLSVINISRLNLINVYLSKKFI